MTKLSGQQIAMFMRAFLGVSGEALDNGVRTERFQAGLASLYNAFLEVFTIDGQVEVRFGDQVIYLNSQKLRLSGAAGERLNALLSCAQRATWQGFSCDEIPNEDQLAAAIGRFAQPELQGNDANLIRQRGPFR